PGAVLGTTTLVLTLVAPTLFVNNGTGTSSARPDARCAPTRVRRPGVQSRQRAGDRRSRLPGDAAAAARVALDARARRHRHAAPGHRPARPAAGMPVVGVVAGVNVLNGLPKNRTSIGAALIGAALTDTAAEVSTAVGIGCRAGGLGDRSRASN